MNAVNTKTGDIKTFVFKCGDDLIRIVWDNNDIWFYTKNGNILLPYRRKHIYRTDFIQLANREIGAPITLLYQPLISQNNKYKCILNYEGTVYTPDNLTTKKRFLKHIEFMKTKSQ